MKLKHILNLYNYDVRLNRVDNENIRIIFSNSILHDIDPSHYDEMNIMKLCIALHAQFGILDIKTDDYLEKLLYGMYIIVTKELGYEILKYFLDNTNDSTKNEEKYFNAYLKKYERMLSDEYSEICKKRVILPELNLYNKRVYWKITDQNETIITIVPFYQCPINIDTKGTCFNIVGLCIDLNRKFNIFDGYIRTVPLTNICNERAYVDTGIEIIVRDSIKAYKLLKYFLENTDLSLMDDKNLVNNECKIDVDSFRLNIYDEYKKRLSEYKEKML